MIASVYDPLYFNLQKRKDSYLPFRHRYKIKDDVKVFSFVCQGGYERKGFWRVIQVLSQLQEKYPLKLMLIGGNPRILIPLQKRLDTMHSDWRDWILMTGYVEDLAGTLSSSDAFFYPSYFESFASVELEAAALGIPLLLTPHFGTEMILAHGKNGIFLSDDEEKMKDQVEDFLKSGIINFSPSTGKGLTLSQFQQKVISLYYEKLSLKITSTDH